MMITPRVSRILFLLLESDRPLSVKELAEYLQISKRTIYRELQDVDRPLKEFGVSLENLPGKGMVLVGDDEGKRRLLEKVSEQNAFDCRNREQRLKRLTLELLKSHEPQKLYYYSQVLQVAEATVNSDLEQLSEWFHEVHLDIVKRPGLGIFIKGEEQDYREACLRYINENREKDFLDRVEKHQNSVVFQIIDRYSMEVIYEIFRKKNDYTLENFTEDSKISFLCYLVLSSQRIRERKEICHLQLLKNIKTDSGIENWIKDILREIEEHFHIRFSEMEFKNLYIYFKGARLQYFSTDQDIENNEYEIQCLLLEMLQCFEPSLQLHMKNDREFIRALMTHLKPMIVRLKHNIKIENPFLDEMKETYPDIYWKACAASEVICQTTGLTVPQEEIGMLAVHFGVAVLRYEESRPHWRRVEIGVVCSNGIGISRLLASRLEKIFHEDIHVVILAQNKITDEALEQIDFLVSTFCLKNINKEVLEVSPMLTDKNLEKIQACIDYYSGQKKQVQFEMGSRQDFLNEVSNAVEIGNDVSHILKGYTVCELEDNTNFDQIIRFAGKMLGDGEEEADLIYEAIMKRERLASQIIPEYRLALLHARTKGIQHPRFILIFPKGNFFTHSSLKETKVIMVMLIPDNGKDSEALEAVSNAIFGHDEFLEAIIQKNRVRIEEYLQFYLKEFLREQLKRML